MPQLDFNPGQYLADLHYSDWERKVQEHHHLDSCEVQGIPLPEGSNNLGLLAFLDSVRKVSLPHDVYCNKMLMVVAVGPATVQAMGLYDGTYLYVVSFFRREQ